MARMPRNLTEAIAHLRSVGLVRTPTVMAVRRIYGVEPPGPLSWCMLWAMYQGIVPERNRVMTRDEMIGLTNESLTAYEERLVAKALNG